MQSVWSLLDQGGFFECAGSAGSFLQGHAESAERYVVSKEDGRLVSAMHVDAILVFIPGTPPYARTILTT